MKISVSFFNALRRGLSGAVAAMLLAAPIMAAPVTVVPTEAVATAAVTPGVTTAQKIANFMSSEVGVWAGLSLGAGAIVLLSRRRRRTTSS